MADCSAVSMAVPLETMSAASMADMKADALVALLVSQTAARLAASRAASMVFLMVVSRVASRVAVLVHPMAGHLADCSVVMRVVASADYSVGTSAASMVGNLALSTVDH